MNEGLALLVDPLFRVPLLTGLAASLALAPIGVLLMLRDEWLAALGLAHLAAAGALGGLALGAPGLAGAGFGALGGGLVKGALGRRGNGVYGFMILIGWALLLLIAANSAVGEGLGQALIDGQLYFARWPELIAALVLALALLWSLPRLAWPLLRARLLPRLDRANGRAAWRTHLGMDLVAALGMAVGTATVGLMGAFALVFVPAWVAFRVARGWRATWVVAGLIGVAGYLGAFVLALALDQPFGPVLVAVLVLLAWGASALQAGWRLLTGWR
ncbi:MULTISPECIES: metal ABC transporter permease [unclassified Marichromatium]|uniref:metal ABC transporter permease n=1 Tax=unclassified Marichromatium TaxID=2618417 RepID=UPI000F3CD09F|nr:MULTISPECIES: metal ABC transporter permease [unclassified Marichromatium]RNE90471.1 ABC transporter [Marichromatium sp. AB31]RNE93607.1 ABC transporter [Marichromatium sp. AB32]